MNDKLTKYSRTKSRMMRIRATIPHTIGIQTGIDPVPASRGPVRVIER